MATARIDGSVLDVRLSPGERIAGMSGGLAVPLDSITLAEVAPMPQRLLRGVRAPGLATSRTKIGTWRAGGLRTLAAIRPDQPALRVDAIPSPTQPYARLLVTVADPAAIAAQINHQIDERVAAGRWGASEHPISFESAGLTLRGTLTVPPPDRDRGIAALLIPGSGRIDRDGDDRRLPIGVSRALAQSLTVAGIASLRFDKRGVGTSEGDWLRTGFDDNLDDARAALRALAGARDGSALVVIGHSEGGLIGIRLAAGPGAPDETVPAAGDPAISAAVLLGTPAKPGTDTLHWQGEQIGASLPPSARAVLRLMRTSAEQQQAKALARIAASRADVVRVQGRRMNARWMREFMAFDPRPDLAGITVPVLAITGSRDIQVDPADLDTIAATVPAPVTIRRMADLSHLLRADPDGQGVKGYRQQVRRPVDPGLLAEVTDWVLAHAEPR